MIGRCRKSPSASTKPSGLFQICAATKPSATGSGTSTIASKPPTVVCLNGLSANIMPTGMITVWGSDFLQYGDDNCTPANQLVYSIRKSGTGTGFPVDANGNPIPGVTFTCSEVGTQFVELWARDARGNAAFCETYIQIQDPFNNCTNVQKATVAGDLKTENAAGLEEANVEITGTHPALPPISMLNLTDKTGHFAFNSAVPLASNFTLTPLKDDNPLNGVTTYDLLLMSRHILGVTPLTSPFQQIAADVNKSGSITTNDIVELRKLILGIYTELPNNTSWRFVDKNWQFANPANPFSPQFPEVKTVADISQNLMAENFTSIKIGDLNGNATANSLAKNDDRTGGHPQGVPLHFDVYLTPDPSPKEREATTPATPLSFGEGSGVRQGEEFSVKITAAELALAYQFTFNFNGLDLLGLTPGEGLGEQNFAVFATEKCLTTSFDGSQIGNFELKFKAKKAGKLSEMLSISSKITKSEGYDLAGNRQEIALRFLSGGTSLEENGKETIVGAGFELYQNQPNPAKNETAISFWLPAETDAVLDFTDATGRLLKTVRGHFARGLNVVKVNVGEFGPASGGSALHYRLSAGENSAARTMILQD